jgi:hypothetical protein
MKKIILVLSVFAAINTIAQKPITNVVTTPTKLPPPKVVTNTPILISPAIINNSVLSDATRIKIMGTGANFAMKRLVPLSGGTSRSNFSMVRGSGVTRETKGAIEKNKDEEGRFCTQVVVDASKGYNEQLVLGNQNDKIYPGAIYNDNAFTTGTYNAPTDLNLRPYNITTNLFASSSMGSSTLQVNPSVGDVYNGIGELMRRNRNVVNAALTGFEVKQISTSEHLAFELGAGFEGYGVNLSADFNYLSSKRKNVYFAKLVQVYFSVTTDTRNPSTLLGTPPSSNNLVYINKVNYGRIAIIQVSSDYSSEQVQAALNFAYSNGTIGASVNARLNYEKVSESSEIKGMFFGGNATNSIPVNSMGELNGFNDYIRGGLRWDPNVTPTPVSYQLSYLNDNSVASTQATTTFTLRTCEAAKGVKIKLHGIAVDDTDNTCGCAWGNIAVTVWETNNDGVPITQILPTGSNPSNNNYWDVPEGRAARVLKYSQLRQNDPEGAVNKDRFNAINIEKVYKIDPEKYAANKILVRFSMMATTDHKDNDFASRGFPSMPQVETREVLLRDLVIPNETIRSQSMIYTYKLGGFGSNSDRYKMFHAMFSITPAN